MKAASLVFLILSVLCYLLIGVARAQVAGCGPTVPFYSVNLAGSATNSWLSPSIVRNGLCTGSSGTDRCTSFTVTTDTGSIMLMLEIVSGSIPSGAMYYQVNYGPLIPVATAMPITGTGPFNITFCKPGNNSNVYAIRTYSRADTMIIGTKSVNMCAQTDLDIGVPNGNWSSSDSTIASVKPKTGVVTGVSAGTAYITYSINGAVVSVTTVTVNPFPAITGALLICGIGGTTTLSHTMAGGQWSSSSVTVATIGTTGIVTGVSLGTTTISYRMLTAGGCSATAIVTVAPVPPAIAGPNSVCAASTVTLTNAMVGGSWTSSDIGVATVVPGSGVVTGIASGTCNISYTSAPGCKVFKAVAVNPLALLSGKNFMCIHLTTNLTSNIAGGTWSCSRPDTASVSTTGLVTGLAQGTALISYATPKGCITTKLIQVNNYYYPLETQPLSTPMRTNICLGNTLGLNSPLGGDGHWTTSDTTKATVSNLVHGSPDPWGVVSALALGTVTISYTASNGCTSTHTITINSMPVITTAPPAMCLYGHTTLNATPAGGQWISHNLTICQVTSWTGDVHASILGVAEIAYRLFTYDQCGYNVLVTVNPCTPRGSGGADPNAAGYTIYPNPGTREFTISQDAIVDQTMHAVVTNCLGRSVFEGNVAFVGGVCTLGLPKLSSGLYMVQLEDRPGARTVLRLAVE